MRVADWQALDSETILHLECRCGAAWTAEESDLHFVCPECEARQKIKPHPKTCPQCPNRYTLRGCPHWITEAHGFEEENIQTGEKRRVTGCYHTVSVRMMDHVVQASNRPAAAVESTRNEIVKGFVRVTDQVIKLSNITQKQLKNDAS